MKDPSVTRDLGEGLGDQPRHRKEGPVVEDRDARIARLLDELERPHLTEQEIALIRSKLQVLQGT